MVLAYLLGRGIEKMMKAAKLSLANQISGAALGMVKALCILSVVINGIVLVDRQEQLLTPTVKEKSILYKPVYATGNKLTESLKQFINNSSKLTSKQ